MAGQPSSRAERVLIERLESRTLLSAGLPGQPQDGYHWFGRAGGFGAPFAPFHRDFAFGRGKIDSTPDGSSEPEVPSLAIVPAPDGHVVGFAPLFFGWHPTAVPSYAGAADFHWAGHDPGHDGPNNPGPSGPSPLLHTPHLPSHESSEDYGQDSGSSEASAAPQSPPSLGEVSTASGSPVVVVLVTQNPAPQIRLVTVSVGIKIEPKVALPDDPPSATSSPALQAQGAGGTAISIAPAVERVAPAVAASPFASAAAVSVLPPLKAAVFSPVGHIALEAAAVARGDMAPEVPAGQSEAVSVRASEALATMVAAPATDSPQIAVITPPAAAVGAIRIATGWVRSAAAVMSRTFDGAPSVSDVEAGYAAPVAYNFLRINPAMLFNDTIGRMIRESASLSPAAASPNHVRAWAVTGAVVAADAILVGYWHINRRRKLRKAQNRSRWGSLPAFRRSAVHGK